MNLMNLVKLAGGLALFIYGMTIMGAGLERVAGAKLEKTLEKMTGNLFKSLLMGIAVTAVIQSSSATTVMAVGFVNAGIMNLKQSVGIILGANIGTTITAQILRLDSTGGMQDSFFMQILKPSNLAYVAVLIGILVLMLGKKKKTKDMADILIGFGILFIGMSSMEGAVSPLRDIPEFQQLFMMISNPVFGVIVGALVTAIIQSSSASVGILQALSTTGMVPYSAAIPIILGQNIGTCITAFLSSLGATKNARRTAMVHFYFNLLGSAIFLVIVYTIQNVIGFAFWDMPIDKGGIANFHTIFNVVATLGFLPFTKQLVRLAEITVPAESVSNDPLAKLEPRFLATPSLAIDQCHKCIVDMANAAKKNFGCATTPYFDHSQFDENKFKERESFLDHAEVEIGNYLLAMQTNLSDDNRKMHAEMLHSLSDFEKIGDYAQNIFDNLNDFRESGNTFSAIATEELKIMCSAVSEVIDLTVEAYSSRSSSIAKQIEPLEEVVDTLKDKLKSRHIERLNANGCTIITGISFLDIVHDLEKIADHCSNIAIYTIQLCEDYAEFDTHSYSKEHAKSSPEFKEKFNFYNTKYIDVLPEL